MFNKRSLKKIDKIKEIIFNQSICFNSAKGYSLSILKPLAEFFEAYCSAISVVGEHTFDSRYINYNYPSSFIVDITNNFFYKEQILEIFKKEVDDSKIVCSWATSSLHDGDFFKSEIYKQRYEPNGLKHGMQSTFMAEDDSICGAIGILRKKDKPYNDEDCENSNLLTPHIFYTYMKYRWLSSFDFYNYDDLDSSICAIVHCDDDGKVLDYNSFAVEVFKDNDIELSNAISLPEVFLNEILQLKNIANNKIDDKFFYRNFESYFGNYRFISFKSKQPLGDEKLLDSNKGYFFVISIEKKSMEMYLKLTKKEQEVLGVLGTGLQNKEIAFDLNVSIKTVENHLDKIFKKLTVSNRTEAALFASEIGLNRYKISKSKY